jgi:hypothetical protein
VNRGRRAALLVGAALAVFAFYVVAYPLHGYRVALGSDTPVYVWWSRYAGAIGLGGLGTGPRAGIVGPLTVLSTITHIPEANLVASVGAVLAVSLALAMGTFVEAALGRNDERFALAVVLTGTFVSLLVPGYFSTLAFGSAFVAGLAVLTLGLEAKDRVAVWAAAALFGAAGLSHALFLVLAAAVVGGGVLGVLPSSRRSVAEGDRLIDSPLGKTGIAAAGGLAVAAAGLGLMGSLGDLGSSGSDRLATARDTVLRRLGLSSLLESSYRRKLVHDFPWYRALTVLGAAVLPFAFQRPRRDVATAAERSARSRLFWGAMGAWFAVTLIGVIALFLGFAVPGQRLAVFCLPLPVFTAVGLWALLGTERGLARAIIVIVAVGYGTVAWMSWNGQPALVTPAAIGEAGDVGAALGRQPVGTPLILVIDSDDPKPGLFVVRSLNYVRAAVPATRIHNVHAFVGSAPDFVAGHPTLTGNREHDVMAGAFWREIQPLLGRQPLAVSIEGFDPTGYRAARALPGAVRLGPGAVALPGFSGLPCGPACGQNTGALRDPGPDPFSPWLPVWSGLVLFGLLAVIGVPWAMAISPSRVALAPAFGLAALGLAAVVIDAVGLRLSSSGGWVTFAVALGAGLIAVTVRRPRRPIPSGGL